MACRAGLLNRAAFGSWGFESPAFRSQENDWPDGETDDHTRLLTGRSWFESRSGH